MKGKADDDVYIKLFFFLRSASHTLLFNVNSTATFSPVVVAGVVK